MGSQGSEDGGSEQGLGGDGGGSRAGVEDALAGDGAGELNARYDLAVDDVDVSVHGVAASLEHHLEDLGDGGVEAVHHFILRGGASGCQHVSSLEFRNWISVGQMA